ncbi:MAG TPA: phosphoribosylglycinamide synthetase C domain-containing protein [Burkholderiales bacterium]|nr:phosphoribosylglycinamide synthetase C domain-containing protein [Burkholderiales bacterium]
MNVLVIDSDSVGLDFAMRCAEHDHAVKLFMRHQNGERDRTGDGLVEKVSDWRKWAQWADLIVPTMNTVYQDDLEQLRKYGYPIFGPSKESARLEIERQAGMQAFKKAGIDVPPYKMFRTLDEAEAACWKLDRRVVFKTLGSEEDKSLTHVARDPADMINTLRRWKKQGMRLKGACMLQDVIEGIEIGVSAWMGRDGFLKPRGENIEHKKEMSGDYGANCGEAGTVMWYTTRSKLSRDVLDPLEKLLRSIGHIGDIDVNCIVDEKGKAWPLEFTARLGWPAFYIMCAQHDEPCKWMLDALQGRDTLKVSEDVFVGVVMALPGWTTKGARQEAWQGIPIQGITDKNWPSLHLINAQAGKGVEMAGDKPVERDMMVTSGAYVLTATGSGDTVKKARKSAYATIDSVHVKNAIVRDDIGEKFEKQLPQLQALGYAQGVQ